MRRKNYALSFKECYYGFENSEDKWNPVYVEILDEFKEKYFPSDPQAIRVKS